MDSNRNMTSSSLSSPVPSLALLQEMPLGPFPSTLFQKYRNQTLRTSRCFTAQAVGTEMHISVPQAAPSSEKGYSRVLGRRVMS